MATTGFRWHVWCRSCRWSVDADIEKLIADERTMSRLLNCAGDADGASHGWWAL
jgi:hypothetical protein